ncbi:leucine-rich repeat receptor-like protein kinase PEPR1 [Physcomitrium patens]|uniref:Protein kinase domain-containing protein n=1 Tax=Physcomitrium patens TaxID=3218 RepID=A0A2K1JG46_PHYPA|nr:probable leucine-rich repeat receptor-like protein kinase At2g33170 [Physcomitrium patens]PNR40522.1 hypothetical protein PHYPA_017924 [Physcomitrium patens]|eukprot:XP_024394507.1 probable leucine-rich repeat receptor-like protein kinase At2g33170 [Physcomitrella patens]
MMRGRIILISRAKRRKEVPRFVFASIFLNLVSLIDLRVAACNSTSCDETMGAASSFVGLRVEQATARRLLAVDSTQTLRQDGDVLIQLKDTIKIYCGDPNNITSMWKPQGKRQAVNPCKEKNGTKQYWRGIDCSADLRVESINLTNLGFSCKLSLLVPSLRSLSRLKHLDLSNNSLTGPIPLELASATALETLHLRSNRLDGQVVPTIFRALSNLTSLDVGNNSLQGSIPPSLGGLQFLETLDMSGNNLTGQIPVELNSCKRLNKVVLSRNGLQGGVPFKSLSNLTFLDVGKNDLSGELPTSLDSLLALQTFDASHNAFEGRFPSFAGLKNLLYLDLSTNKLTSPIPREFYDLMRHLSFLNVSDNDLRGEVPPFDEHRGVTSRSFLNNPHLCGKTLNKKCSTEKSMLVAISVGGTVGCLVMVLLMYVCCSRCLRNAKSSKSSATVSAEVELNLSSEDVTRITQNFSEQNYIGIGSMSTVYRGQFLDGTAVAVKRLTIRRGEMSESAQTVLADRFEILGHIRHSTLVKVMGYCCSPDMKALVMEYMPNGTLSNLMYPSGDAEVVKEFNWTHRINAAISVAEGLKYLHHDCPTPTVHGDLKPSNIMFNTFMEARMSDFGVAKALSDNGIGPSASIVATTSGYLAPESARQACTIKGDVYSFGIIVLEMISSRSPQSLEAGQTLPQWIRDTIQRNKSLKHVLDPILMSELRLQQQRMAMVLGVALLCTREDPKERPYITEILKMLNHIKANRQDGSLRGSRGSRRLRSSLRNHQRNEEVPGINVQPWPPSAGPSAPRRHVMSLPHNPTLSDWTQDSAENR